MPYQVSVGSQVVEFPDSVSQEEAQKILADKFPPTGEDIANALQDPNFTPTQEQYQLFEDYNKTRQTDWLQSLLTAADTVVQTAGAAGKAALTTGAAFNPKNYVEGLAQGTAQLYGLVAQSQDPDSALFKLNNLISGTGTLENRYDQFLQARQFNKDLDAYAKGDMSIMFKPEDLNPEFVQGVAMVADPTMFVPGVGQLLGAEKVAAKAVGKAAAVAGRGVQAVSKPVERLSAAAGKFVTEVTGISPEALRGAATTSGVLAATGVGPAIGAVGAVPFIAEAATDVGRALETAGAQAGRAPTRIGALEAVGAIPEANMRQRIIGTVGRYGGDAALRTALAGTAGTLEGAALGGVLGYLSGGEEGAASGIGSGGVAGALGSLGARGLQTLTGSEAKAARLNDLTTYVDTLAPEKKAAYQSVQERFGTDTAANLMDLESLIKGTRGDIGVEILRGDEFQKRAGVTARGVVPDENAATPRILINVDAMPKVKGDSPIYTLGHELLHALAKTKQFQGDVTGFVETLTGAYVPNPDGTVRLVSEGQYSPAKVEQLFNDYVKQLPEDARANVISANPTASDRAVYVGEELAAEQVGRILSSQKPDAFLRGFGSTRQNFTDMLLLQEASRVGSKIGQLIERTFGITPTDSVLFPEIKNASPALDAALRRLLKARENIDEALLNADYQKSFKIDQKAITDPVAADYAVRGGFAERLPTGEVRLLTNGELLQRETRDVTALKQIIDGLPGAKIDINGEVVGDLSPEQLDAIKGSSVSSQMQQRLEMTNRSINEGRSLFVEYYPATEKVQDPTSKRWRTKYASRRVTFREVLPYNLLLSKENNSYVRAIDLTQVRKSLQRSIRPDGSVGGLWSNVGEFLGELNAYLSNLDRKENAIPSRKIFGPDKAEFFGNFMNSLEKGGSEFIHSFRLDRMGQMDPSDFRAKFSESAYRKMKDRFMPAGSVGEEQAWKSGDGFTILTSGNKFRLYGPEGKLLGIYDSAEQAQRKANATQARIQSENDQLQYPARDEVGQTAEAGNRNRALDRTQGREEGRQANRQVRQEGDVRFMPMSDLERSDLDLRISTRNPSAKRATEDPLTQQLSIDLESIMKTPGALPEIINTVGKYPGIKFERSGSVNRANDFIRFVANNLIYLHDNVPSDIRQRSKLWYDGARKLTEDWSKRFDTTREGVAGVIASLSPQKDWYQNVTLAERVFEVVKNRQDEAFTGPIEQWARTKMTSGQSPKRLVQDEVINGMAGKKFSQLSDYEKAVFVRAFDEVNNTRTYPIVSPEGQMLDIARKADGTPATYAWGDFNSIAKAVKIAGSPNKKTVSESLGFEHKVRSFYDNILLPNNPEKGDVTIDTHAVAAALMLPLAGSDVPVAHNFGQGVPGSSVYGTSGTYGIYADAYRLAAQERGILPREMQSITWEAIRGLFTPEFKTAQNKKLVENLWKEYKTGKVTLDETRQRIVDTAGGIRNPSWYGSGGGAVAENAPTAQPQKLSVAGDMGRPGANAGGGGAVSRGSAQEVGAQRFMPSDADYLAAVKAGDTAQAQRMVDEAAKAAGYTVGPVYHGTPNSDFTVFDPKKIGSKTVLPLGAPKGFYFAKDQSISKKYGDKSIRAFLKGPFLLENDKIVVAESSDQIKSADPITRDDAGNVIPLSQRFQSSSADIRYMPAPVPDPSIPGAYSMSGYRILPGKTKGKLRVYSPSGSLVGVVGSVDDAQRMIQKKLQ